MFSDNKDELQVQTIHVNKSEFIIIKKEDNESVFECLAKQDKRYDNDIVNKFINIRPSLDPNFFTTDQDDPSLVYLKNQVNSDDD
jgi:hypothetical protein